MAYQSFDATFDRLEATVQSFMATLQQQSPRADSIGFFPTTNQLKSPTQVSVSSSEQYGNSPPLGYRQVAENLDNHEEERFIEIPVFSGDDLRPWIDWMENRFAAEDFTDDQKMALAYAVIRGEAGSWYNKRRPFQNWKDLKDAMLLRYGNHNDQERIAFCLELEQRWQETEMMTPSPSFLVTDSIPEAEETNVEETDSCLVNDCDHDYDDNDHDDSVLVQDALHYEETIFGNRVCSRSRPD
ncbi:uncharacterized protein LOC130500984 [Raphanus sativus]|uniref:Uncharacterized protein LOC130500984 n=1 Tax=Raphanus sativus TaxID=3726 RepID=A0A9W3CK26_RAPSA|nr:uncharacterized protein LOC130500984 [Raphanus sativus]